MKKKIKNPTIDFFLLDFLAECHLRITECKNTTENQNIEDELYSFLNPNIESNPEKRKNLN